MTYGDRVLAFLKIGAAKKIKGYVECDVCFQAVTEYVEIDGRAVFTCPNGHENK